MKRDETVRSISTGSMVYITGWMSGSKEFCERHGTEITVINDETFSPEEELVRDLIAIVTVFSARLQGQRSHKNLIRAAALGKNITDDQGTQDQTPSHA